jgi:hypothetical protein
MHLIELIDTHHTTVCKDHRSTFQIEISLCLIHTEIATLASWTTLAVRPAAEDPFPEV